MPSCAVCFDLAGPTWEIMRDWSDAGHLEVQPFPIDRVQRLPSVVDIRKSSDRGCFGCRVVNKILDSHASDIDDHLVVSAIVTDIEIRCEKAAFKICVFPDIPAVQEWKFTLEFEVSGFPGRYLSYLQRNPFSKLIRLDCQCPWDQLQPAPPVSGDTGSDEAVARVRSWLNECMFEHTKCANPVCGSLPTRVIHINGPKEVRLYVTVEEVQPYICLSHCWGRQPVIRTTKLTLKQHQAQIPWQELPRTFQDAISFTYRLGFRYLWIDSLCIIQDSIDDWRHEGSKMATIYENASLTIAASRSTHSNGGCFATDPLRHSSHTWTFTSVNGKTYDIHTRSPIYHESFQTADLPLFKRGWTLQERILSPRIVHFTEQELVWECCNVRECECSMMKSFAIFTSDVDKKRLDPRLWMNEPLHIIDEKWRNIVRSYTSTSLTYSKDVFPALQGLAKKMPASMGPYLAGLWSDTLLFNLTWKVSQHSSSTRPTEWRAPTWSWASVTGKISWGEIIIDRTYARHPRARSFIRIISAGIIIKGTDPLGEMSSGELVIQGRGVWGEVLHPKSQRSSGAPSDQSVSSALLVLDLNGRKILYEPGLTDELYWDYRIEAMSSDYVENYIKVLVVKIEHDPYSETRWLVLKPVEQGRDEFHRIGYLSIQSGSHNADYDLEDVYESSPEIEMRII